jgi:hypothetical protein
MILADTDYYMKLLMVTLHAVPLPNLPKTCAAQVPNRDWKDEEVDA